MTLTLSKTIPVASLALLGYALLASSAQASVTSELNKCRYDTKQKVIECCNRVLRDEDKPQWMLESNRNCRSAAVCFGQAKGGGSPVAIAYVAAKPKKKCFIKIQLETYDGGDTPDIPQIEIPQRQPRGNRSFN
jgi:hypothetical protein